MVSVKDFTYLNPDFKWVRDLADAHRYTGESAGGFLSLCACGEGVDDMNLHMVLKTLEYFEWQKEIEQVKGRVLCYVCGSPCSGGSGAVIHDVFMAMCDDGESPTCYETWKWENDISTTSRSTELLDQLLGGSFNG